MNIQFLKISFLFFLSGFAGLIYQIIWVRQFGNVFGNTIHSAALISGLFLAGLGFGAYIAGNLSDQMAESKIIINLKLYAFAEIFIAGYALVILLIFPHLEFFSAAISTYVMGPNGRHFISSLSLFYKTILTFCLFFPVTVAMGTTLSLLVKFFLFNNLNQTAKIVGTLYGVNTLGAALACFLVDFSLIPRLGIFSTNVIGICLSLISGFLALAIVQNWEKVNAPTTLRSGNLKFKIEIPQLNNLRIVIFLCGVCGMGLEIIWFRFLTSSLLAKREVFSLLLGVLLISMWLGSISGSFIIKKFKNIQAVFSFYILGILIFSFMGFYFYKISLIITLHQLYHVMLLLFIPGLFMGGIYPIANAIEQSSNESIGKNAGELYLFNTFGALIGSLLTGYFFLPYVGIQNSILILLVLLFFTFILFNNKNLFKAPKSVLLAAVLSLAIIVIFSFKDKRYILTKSFIALVTLTESQNILSISEGILETIAIIENSDKTKSLYVNGYPMSGTDDEGQRYMRSFVHIPLMHQESPTDILVICFGVGNTAHAASLHSSVQRIDLVDLSNHVFDHAGEFLTWNHDVIKNQKVNLYVNDGRQHLRMNKKKYDLITLEPPPLVIAGVSSLYSQEFYQLAKDNLKNGGIITQWLPSIQLPKSLVRSLVKSFVEVFPNSIMFNGAMNNFVLMGIKGDKLDISTEKIRRFLKENPAVAGDLAKYNFHNEIDILGSYLNNGENLLKITENDFSLTDDYPIMEYSWNEKNDTIDLDLLDPQRNFSSWCSSCNENNINLQMTRWYLTYMHDLYRTPGFIFKYAAQLGGNSPTLYRFSLSNEQLTQLFNENKYLEKVRDFTLNY